MPRFLARERAQTATTSMRRPQRALKRLALARDLADQRGADRAQTGNADFEELMTYYSRMIFRNRSTSIMR